MFRNMHRSAPFQQNDAGEFCLNIIDRICDTLKEEPVLKWYFGGKTVGQMKRKCGVHSKSISSFRTLNLPIKGFDSVEKCLDEYVKATVMEGSNQLACECQECSANLITPKKVDGIKRDCFEVLPNLLILQLKRFEHDFERGQQYKINNRCEFPMILNMEKYTRQYLDRQDEEIEMKAKKEDDDDEEEDEDEKKENEKNDISSTHEYDFKLKGIIVHIGSLDSGHYYSIIRDDKDSWYRFNDDTVEVYDIESDLEYECFGGAKNSKGNPLNVSAYMLLYVIIFFFFLN